MASHRRIHHMSPRANAHDMNTRSIWSDAALARTPRQSALKTGGSNVQFGVTRQRKHGRLERTRDSRYSALASKATGFPSEKIAAKTSVSYTLDEIPNDITRKTPACLEPTLDT